MDDIYEEVLRGTDQSLYSINKAINLLNNINNYPKFNKKERKKLHEYVYKLILKIDNFNNENIKTYLKKYAKEEINKDKFNSFLLRLFKNKNLYNEYKDISPLLKDTYEDYVIKVKDLCSRHHNLVYMFAKAFIDNPEYKYDLNNEIENYILDFYVMNNLIKKRLNIETISTICKYLFIKVHALNGQDIQYKEIRLKDVLKNNKESKYSITKNYFEKTWYTHFLISHDSNNLRFKTTKVEVNIDSLYKAIIKDNKIEEIYSLLFKICDSIMLNKDLTDNLYAMNRCSKELIARSREISLDQNKKYYYYHLLNIEYVYEQIQNLITSLSKTINDKWYEKELNYKHNKSDSYPLSASLLIKSNIDYYSDKEIKEHKININEYPGLSLEYKSDGSKKDLSTLLTEYEKCLNYDFDSNILEFDRLRTLANSCICPKEDKDYYESVLKLYEEIIMNRIEEEMQIENRYERIIRDKYPFRYEVKEYNELICKILKKRMKRLAITIYHIMSTYHKYNYEVTKEVEEQLKKHWLKLVDYYCKFGSFVIDESIYNECIEESASFIETDDLVRECFKHDFKKRVYRNNKNRTYY